MTKPEILRLSAKRLRLPVVSAIATLSAALSITSGPIFAQQATSAPTSSSETSTASGELSEVTVTAQRREENLQRVPIAVTVFTAADLEKTVTLNTTDLLLFVPNVMGFNNGNQPGQANYYFRGVGTPDGLQTFDSPVVTYLDDVPLGRIVAANINFLDVSSIQVLQGPQGTLFGRNTTGGAILYEFRKPTSDFEFSQEVEYGSRNLWQIRETLNQPITDNLFSSLTGYLLSQDGYLTSLTTGDEYNGQFSYGVRGALRFVPSDSVEWNLSVDYSRQNGTALDALGKVSSEPTGQSIPGANNAAGTYFGSLLKINTFLDLCETGSGTNPVVWESKGCQDAAAINSGITSNVHWTLSDNLGINFITGFRQTLEDYNLDFTGNNPAPGSFPLYDLANDSVFTQFSQEIKATGNAFSNRIKYVGGLFFFHEYDKSLIDTYYNFTSIPSNTFLVSNDYLSNATTSAAAYAQADTILVDNLTLTTGVRFTHDVKTVHVNYIGGAFGGPNFDTSDIYGDPRIVANKATPKVALQYQFTPDLMSYISYTNGFKSGGWSGRASTAAGFNDFTDETVNSYEAGARTEFLDHRVRLNLTLFRANYKDLQINTAYEAPNGTSIYVTGNAGNAYDQGAQFESAFVILPELTARLTAGWQHSEYTYLTGPAIIASGFTVGGHLTQTPPRTFSAGLDYKKSVSPLGGAITASTQASYLPSYNPHVTGGSTATQNNFLLNAQLGYQHDGSKFDYLIECRNCTWHYYLASPFDTGGGALGVMPFFGFKVRYKF